MSIRIHGAAGRHGHINLTIEEVAPSNADGSPAHRQPEPTSMYDPAFRTAIRVMARLAELAEKSGQTAIAGWLRSCIESFHAGQIFPDAPSAVPDVERSEPLVTKDGTGPWKSGGGAGQWNG